MVQVCLKEPSMPLSTPKPDRKNREAAKQERQAITESIFHAVESQDGAGTDRAHVIAICTGLFSFALLISQFGRPSRAREAEFLHASAKVAALGKPALGAEAVNEVATLRIADAKELTPAVYANRKYGVELQYPRTYVLRKGANSNLDLYGHPATESALASPGAVILASVIIPARVYAGTDFSSAALTARVNTHISEDACGQFRRASSDTGDDVALASSAAALGAIDFAEADVDAAEAASGADAANLANGAAESSTQEKFFHVYENDACYEFAMRVTTGASTNVPNPVRVHKDDIFDQLSEILTSVTIVPVRDTTARTEAHSHRKMRAATE